MKIEKVDQPIYRVEFNEDVFQMLKDILGNMDRRCMGDIGVDVDQYDILVEFYSLLTSI